MPTDNGVRVTEAWVEDNEPLNLELDFVGVTEGAELIEARPGVFALVATIMAQGKPVYFSREKRVLSTDPFFASQAPDTQTFEEAFEVMDADPLWDFKNKTGILIVTLKNRSVAHVPFSDPAVLAGWVLTCDTHAVVFDGTSLKSRRN